MKRFVLASVIVGTLISPALSADLASRYTKAPIAPPIYNWTGFYGGFNAGGAWGTLDDSASYTPANGGFVAGYPELLNAQSRRFKSSSFVGGGQIGYNWQIASWLLGVEADAQYMRLKGAYDTGVIDGPFGGGAQSVQFANSAEANGLYTIRGRVGFVVDRALIYATGGVAFTQVKGQSLYTVFASPRSLVGTGESFRTGYAVGGGVEYAFTNQWTAKIEYLHADFGRMSFSTVDTSAFVSAGTVTNTIGVNLDLVRIGANYKFGGPLVAKY